MRARRALYPCALGHRFLALAYAVCGMPAVLAQVVTVTTQAGTSPTMGPAMDVTVDRRYSQDHAHNLHINLPNNELDPQGAH